MRKKLSNKMAGQSYFNCEARGGDALRFFICTSSCRSLTNGLTFSVDPGEGTTCSGHFKPSDESGEAFTFLSGFPAPVACGECLPLFYYKFESGSCGTFVDV